MTKTFLVWLLVIFFVANVFVAQAQQARIPRIGYLHGATAATMAARNEAFQQGLRELGYVEGKTVVIEYRYAEGKPDRLPALAAELVGLKLDVIVSAGAAVTRAAKATTSTIPIVMTNETDPVGTGVVTSLARPGGNITGLSTLAPEISGKQLELLHEVVPKILRIAVLGISNNPGYAQALNEIERAATGLKVKLQYLDVLDPKDIESAFRAANKENPGGLIVLPSSVLITRRSQIVELALKNRLPAIYNRSDYVEEGGLMTYSTSLSDLDRRAATFVDKTLKGRAPADLPVEQPLKFEFIVNLKAANQIGLTIPPNVLARADKVIK